MGTRVVTPYLVGLALHSEGFREDTLAPQLSTATQRGAEPDQPEATVQGGMELHAVGTMPTAGQTVEVVAVKEGGPVGGAQGGRLAYRIGANSVPDVGWLSYNKPTGWERIRANASGTGFSRYVALRTSDHKAVVAYVDQDTAGDHKFACSVRDPDADTWSHVDIYAPGTSLSYPTLALVRLPGGRLLAFYTREDLSEGATVYLTLGFSYSDDDGATWSEGGRHMAGFQVAVSGFTTGRTSSAIYHNSYISLALNLLDSAGDVRTYHLVSADRGASFTEVETVGGGADTRQQFHLVADRAGAVVAVYTQSTGQLYAARKAGPFRAFADDPSWDTVLDSTADINVSNQRGLAVTVDDAGSLWAVWTQAAANRHHVGILHADLESLTASTDRWTAHGVGSGYGVNWPLNLGADAVYLEYLALVPHKGSLWLISGNTGGSGHTTGAAAVILGGYSTRDWPIHTWGKHAAATPSILGQAWIPIDFPHNMGWTRAGAGGTIAITDEGMRVQTAGAADSWWRAGGAGTPPILWVGLRADAGGSSSSARIGGLLRRADGSTDTRCEVRLTTTGAALYDVHGATMIASVTGLTASEDREWLCAIGSVVGSDLATLRYRTRGSTRWTLAASGTLTDKGSAWGANSYVEFGALAVGTVDVTLFWAWSSCDIAIASGLSNGSQALEGRAFSTRPIYLAGGLQIRASGGSAFLGDAWTCATRFSHGLHLVDPLQNSSPARTWEATDEAEQLIAWRPVGSSVAPIKSALLASSWVVGLYGTNVGTATFEGWDGIAWVVLGTLDSTSIGGPTLTYDIDGDWVRPKSSTPIGDQVVSLHELVGGTALLYYSGGTGTSPLPVRIVGASEGLWADPFSSRGVDLRVECVRDGRSLTDVGTPTTLELRPASLAGVIHQQVYAYEAYGVRLAAATTDTGRTRCGPIIIAPLTAFGRKPSRGAQERLEPNVAVQQDRAGARLVEQLGPERRIVTLPFGDLIPLREIQSATPDPRFIAAADAAKGLAFRHDSTLFAALLRRARGGAVPGIWLPRVGLDDGGGAQTYVLREQHMLCRISGSVDRVRAMGWAYASAVETSAGLRLEEEV